MKSIKKNFLYNLMYQMLLILAPLITIPYVSRVLGPPKIGQFAYTYSIVSYFVLVAMLGVKNYGNRTIAIEKSDREKRSKNFWEIFFIQFIMSILMLIIYFFYVILFENDGLFYIQSLYIIAGMFDISWFYFGMEEFKFTAIRSSIIKILSIVLIFIFVKEQADLYIYAMILSVSTLLSQVPLWIPLKKFIDLTRIQLKDVARHIKPNFILFIPVLAVSMYTILDKIMLGSMSSMQETAFFESTEKIVNVPFGVIMALGSVMLPRTAFMIKNGDEKKSIEYLELSMYFIMIISFAMTFGISGVSKIFTPLFFGNEFSPAARLITFISPIIIFKAWANVIRTQFLIPRSRDRDYVISVFIGAIINIISNIILIPKLNALGAVLSTVLAEGSVAIYQTIRVRRDLPIVRYILNSLPFLFAGIFMNIALNYLERFLSSDLKSLILLIVAGAIFYLFEVIIIFWYKKELHLITNIMKGEN